MPRLSLKRLVSSSEEVKGFAKRGVRMGESSSGARRDMLD